MVRGLLKILPFLCERAFWGIGVDHEHDPLVFLVLMHCASKHNNIHDIGVMMHFLQGGRPLFQPYTLPAQVRGEWTSLIIKPTHRPGEPGLGNGDYFGTNPN